MLQNLLEGRFVAVPEAASIPVLNPSTGRVIGACPETPGAVVDEAVASAKRAQPAWAKLPAARRAGHLHAIARLVRDRRGEIARTISEEQGKLLSLAHVEVDVTADYIDYMAEWARRIEGEIIPSDRVGETIFLFRRPLGVVAGILPWNFPLFLFARKMAPALVAGNTIVVKPSEETPLNAHLLAEIIARSGLPDGVVNVVHGRGPSVGAALARHRDIALISFTGSVAVGAAIMAMAATNITKVNLELGGKAPAIVMDDADLELAVRAVTASRLTNNGQVCNCAERIYVHDKVADEFVDRLSKAFAATSYGDPLGDADPGLGPLINGAAADKVQAMVDRAVAGGATVTAGGKRDGRDGGSFFQPTVLSGCRVGSEIMRDEIFGPVAPVQIFGDFDEAIAYANDSDYGLTSSIYTTSLATAMRAVEDLHFGETYINRENFEAMQGFHAGWRKSGIGGADGKHGLLEFTQTQVVYLQI